MWHSPTTTNEQGPDGSDKVLKTSLEEFIANVKSEKKGEPDWIGARITKSWHTPFVGLRR